VRREVLAMDDPDRSRTEETCSSVDMLKQGSDSTDLERQLFFLMAPLPFEPWKLIFSPSWTPKKLTGAIDATTVQRWFREVAKDTNLAVPALEACEPLARFLNNRIFLCDYKQDEFLNDAGRKGGRQYLSGLLKTRQKLQSVVSTAKTSDPYEAVAIAEINRDIESIDRLIRQVKITLTPPLRLDWHDRARWVSGSAIRAWEITGKAPRDKGARQPLCQFVKLALEATGCAKSESAISDVLRGRRGCGDGSVTRPRRSKKK
jgi:hypothetical protein